MSQDDISCLFGLDRVLDQLGAQNFVSVFVFFIGFINGRKQRVWVGILAQGMDGENFGYIQQQDRMVFRLVPFFKRNCSKLCALKILCQSYHTFDIRLVRGQCSIRFVQLRFFVIDFTG